MKKIGFVDYYLSEWHANNYPAWMGEICAAHGLDFAVTHGFALLDVSPKDGVSSAEWCEKMGVKLCHSIQELCEAVDAVVILAPSDPDKHLALAAAVLPYGKPTYIDKTFAPDLATASEIVALSKKYNTPFFSTSALRYATELELADGATRAMITGGGSNAAEYLVHTLEMLVCSLGKGATSVRAEQQGKDELFFHFSFADERAATVLYAERLPFNVYFSGMEKPVWKNVKSDYFRTLMHEILKFFDSGKPPFEPAETLEVMRLRDGALAAMDRIGETVALN